MLKKKVFLHQHLAGEEDAQAAAEVGLVEDRRAPGVGNLLAAGVGAELLHEDFVHIFE